MAARKPEVHHIVPRCLLFLHEQANGTELDGEGIQAWLEWEMEAMRWGVPIEISRNKLETLVNSSEVLQQEGHQLLPEARSEPETVGGAETVLKPPRNTSKGKERA